MKYNRFVVTIREDNKITIPKSVIKMFCLDNNFRETELLGCILELKIVAIHINHRRIVLSEDSIFSKERKPKQE